MTAKAEVRRYENRGDTVAFELKPWDRVVFILDDGSRIDTFIDTGGELEIRTENTLAVFPQTTNAIHVRSVKP